MKLSIIIPAYNEEANIPQIVSEVDAVLGNRGDAYEVIIVDDGSTDGTRAAATALTERSAHVKLLALARNFGQTAALTAGIDAASGEIIVTLDADLQNDPKDIPRLLREIELGADVVVGWRRHRKDGFLLTTLPSRLANRLIRCLSGVPIHDLGCTLKAFKKTHIASIKLYGEMHRFIPLYLSTIGGKLKEIEVNHRPRINGKSNYTILKAVNVILDFITAKFLMTYRTKPMHFFGKMSFATFAFSLLIFVFLLIHKYRYDISIVQSPLLIIFAVFFLISTQFILLGLLSEMQMRTYFESQQKPSYHVAQQINF